MVKFLRSDKWKEVWENKGEELVIAAILRAMTSSLFGTVVGLATSAIDEMGTLLSFVIGLLAAFAVFLLLFTPKIESLFRDAEKVTRDNERADRLLSLIDGPQSTDTSHEVQRRLSAIMSCLRGMGAKRRANQLEEHVTMTQNHKLEAIEVFVRAAAEEIRHGH